MSEFSREMLSFVEISRERSIRKAADKLNVASSALSRQMRILESDLGVQLFTRDVRGVELTVQGRILLDQAQAWLEDSNRLRTRLSELEGGGEQRLRIGAMECFATTLIPELFEFAQSERPHGRMAVKFGDTATLLEELSRHAIDLVIVFNAHHSQSLRVLFEAPCRVGLVYRRDQYSIPDPEISIADCLDWPICLPGEDLSLHPRLYSEILQQRKKPNIVSTSNSVEFIRNLVIRGKAISFLTWYDVRDAVLAGQISFVPLAEKRLSESLCICVSGTVPLSPFLSKFARETERMITGVFENGQPGFPPVTGV